MLHPNSTYAKIHNTCQICLHYFHLCKPLDQFNICFSQILPMIIFLEQNIIIMHNNCFIKIFLLCIGNSVVYKDNLHCFKICLNSNSTSAYRFFVWVRASRLVQIGQNVSSTAYWLKVNSVLLPVSCNHKCEFLTL